METIEQMVWRGVEQLLGRAGGPLHLRLVMMPTVVTLLAIRAGLGDAREGRRAFLWSVLAHPGARRQALRSAVRDIHRVFIMAVILDTIYQLAVLRAFYPVQLLILAIGCAVVPYVLVRGPVARLMRLLNRRLGRLAPDPGAGAGRT
jgi:hypothetical protein